MLKNRIHLPRKAKMEQGQSIVLIALAFIGLVAFIGLAIDTGILFVGYGHLRRATDAAALAAAAQFRENYTNDQLNKSATEFLRLNGVDLDNASATVFTCEAGSGTSVDTSLCQTGSTPKRKLVRVQASGSVKFSFLPILGINEATITSSANAEAATLDVVLIIDNSESMAKDSSNHVVDPSVCNPDNTCHPFAEVKAAADFLLQKILDKSYAAPGPSTDEDRISIVEFSNGWQQTINRKGPNQGTYVVTIPNSTDGWTNNYADAVAAIDSLQVYDPGVACTSAQANAMGNVGDTASIGPCRYIRDDGTYGGLTCPLFFRNSNPDVYKPDASTCTTTNIGGGLFIASNMFKHSTRPESVWVEVLLTDGVPNATCAGDAADTTCWPTSHVINPLETDSTQPDSLPIDFCPNVLRDPGDPNSYENNSQTIIGGEVRANFCQPLSALSHHSKSSTLSPNPYDPQDYAIDNAYYAACDPVTPSAGCNGTKGQGAILFTIGLGPEVASKDAISPPVYRGETILREIAAVGDDGNPATDPCSSASSLSDCGNYYYAPTGNDLIPVFDAIAGRIFTRITK
jgi:Flp pilus assembly protein TadG